MRLSLFLVSVGLARACATGRQRCCRQYRSDPNRIDVGVTQQVAPQGIRHAASHVRLTTRWFAAWLVTGSSQLGDQDRHHFVVHSIRALRVIFGPDVMIGAFVGAAVWRRAEAFGWAYTPLAPRVRPRRNEPPALALFAPTPLSMLLMVAEMTGRTASLPRP